jgi:signal transduction histidine kinase
MSLAKELSEHLDELTKEQIYEFAKSMKESSENVYNLLENLLKWSQFQRGIIEFTPEITFFNFIVDSNIEIIKAKAKQKNIEVINKITTNFTILADVKMLNLILRNLLSNAVKFTRKGGLIEVGQINQNDLSSDFDSLNLQPGSFTFYIKDNGIGMPDNIKNNLFRLDYNVSRQGTDNEPSTGLGLVLCKEFVDIHKGKIWIESKENVGTTFYINIPQLY